MKKMIALLLAVLLIGCLAGCSGDAPTQTAAPGVQNGPTNPPVLPNNGVHTPAQLYGNITVTMELQEYPEYYGGCYIEESTQVVVILATDQDRAQAGLDSVLSLWEEDAYRFEKATLSYQELLAVQQQVEAAQDTLAAQDVRVTEIAIDAKAGKVCVGIVGLDSAKEQAVRALVDSAVLQLHNSDAVSEN